MGETPAFVAVDWNGTVVPFFRLPPYPGALEVLRRLRSRGTPLFVVSRADPRTIRDDVERTGLVADGVYGCDDKAPVLSELRSRLGPGLFIGDTPADRRAAEAAGLPFVHARLEPRSPLPDCADAFGDWAEAETLLLAPSGAGE